MITEFIEENEGAFEVWMKRRSVRVSERVKTIEYYASLSRILRVWYIDNYWVINSLMKH